MTRLAPLIFGASLLVACVGTKTLEDGQRCPCAPGWSCYTPTNQCVHDTGGAGGSDPTGAGGAGGELPRNYDAAEVEAALAQCDSLMGRSQRRRPSATSARSSSALGLSARRRP